MPSKAVKANPGPVRPVPAPRPGTTAEPKNSRVPGTPVPGEDTISQDLVRPLKSDSSS